MARAAWLIPSLILLSAGSASGAYPTIQLQYSWPLRLGGELGVTWTDYLDFPVSSGPYLSVSGGRDGIGLNAGLKGAVHLIVPVASASIGVSGMYLWDDPDAAYAGLRLSLANWLAGGFGGVYRRISGDRDDDWLFSLGVGLGLP